MQVKRFSNRCITDKVTFGQIYAKKLTSTLTPLHEYVLEKWYFDRMILIGDSVHKVSRNSLQSTLDLANFGCSRSRTPSAAREETAL
jgi:hypothetical protein